MDGAVVGLLIVAAALATGPSEIDIRGLVALIGGDPPIQTPCNTPGLETKYCPNKGKRRCNTKVQRCRGSHAGGSQNINICTDHPGTGCLENDDDCQVLSTQTANPEGCQIN